MIALSYGALKDAECPFRFNVLRIEKSYKEPESDAMLIGAAFAKVADRYRNFCLTEKVSSDLEVLDKIATEEGRALTEDQFEAYGELVERFKNSEFSLVPVEHIAWAATEYQAAYDAELKPIKGDQAWFSPDVAFRAVADFIYRVGPDELVIVDDKTGRGTPDPKQLKIYAALMPRSIGMSPTKITVVFNNVRGRKTVQEFCQAELRDVDDELSSNIVDVNAWTEFPALACNTCKWCSIPTCPLKQQTATALETHPKVPILKVPDAISSPLEAEQALLFVNFAESIVDQIKAILRGYVKDHGPVSAGGKVAELRANEPWKCTDVEKAVKIMAAWGIPVKQIWGGLSLTESAAEKLLKKNKMADRLAMILAQGERKKYAPRFGIYNDKAGEI